MMEVGTLKSAKQIQEQTQSGTSVAHKKLNQHIQSPNLWKKRTLKEKKILSKKEPNWMMQE